MLFLFARWPLEEASACVCIAGDVSIKPYGTGMRSQSHIFMKRLPVKMCGGFVHSADVPVLRTQMHPCVSFIRSYLMDVLIQIKTAVKLLTVKHQLHLN